MSAVANDGERDLFVPDTQHVWIAPAHGTEIQEAQDTPLDIEACDVGLDAVERRAEDDWPRWGSALTDIPQVACCSTARSRQSAR